MRVNFFQAVVQINKNGKEKKDEHRPPVYKLLFIMKRKGKKNTCVIRKET